MLTMRVASVLALVLAIRVVAQSASTEPDSGSGPSTEIISTQSDPPASGTPTSTISDIGTTETTTATSTFTTVPPTGTPPAGGGATCVQSCLAKAASQAGCQSIADVPCICQSGVYISAAQDCFSSSACENADVRSAIGDYGTVCRNGNASPGTNPSRSVSATLTQTRPYSGSLASPTTQTLIVTSGAVITLPGGSTTTIISGFTTTRTGQAGDFNTGAIIPNPGASGAPSNSAIAAQPVAWSYGGILAGLGIVGGALVLAN